MLPVLANLSPDACLLLLTVGIALIAIELNRPGWILPGAFGLLLSLLAAAALIERHPRPASAVAAAACIGLLLLQSRRGLPLVFPVSATILLVVAFSKLLPATAPNGVSLWVAILAGVILGAGTSVLTRIARRARENKGLD